MSGDFRNRVSPATSGSVTLTQLNANPPSGPSAFTGQSVGTAGGAAVADPSGKQSSVIKVTPGAALARLDWKPGDLAATRVSSSHRIRLDAKPTGNPWQVTNLQAGVVDAGGAITSQATAVALNWVKATNSLQVQRGASKYDTLAGVALVPGQFLTFNVWADIATGDVGVAVYDEAGALLGMQALTGVALSAATGTTFVTGQWGKTSTADTGATAYISSVAVDLGVANDLGAAPSMAVATPPTIDLAPHQRLDGGQRIVITARVKPTTPGATAGPTSCEVTGATHYDGTPYPEAPLPAFAPVAETSAKTDAGRTVTISASQNLEAGAPFLPQTAVYSLRITGSDSTGLPAAAQTCKVTVKAHPVWLDGKPADLRPGTGVA